MKGLPNTRAAPPFRSLFGANLHKFGFNYVARPLLQPCPIDLNVAFLRSFHV